MSKWIFLLLYVPSVAFGMELHFIAIDVQTGREIIVQGDVRQRSTSSSTFKIALSVIGYDCGILKNDHNPQWSNSGSPETHGPKSWIHSSLIWYSKMLIKKIGRTTLQEYVHKFCYGNEDIAGPSEDVDGYTTAHLSSSLKISPKEQAHFIQNLLLGRYPVSFEAVTATQKILPSYFFGDGWTLFCKTGTGYDGSEDHKVAWLVGWIEKGKQQYSYALLLKDIPAIPSMSERKELVQRFFLEAFQSRLIT
jgi:beta-lactamase class D